MGLLSHLKQSLSSINESWKSFDHPQGDMRCFQGIKDSNAVLGIDRLREYFAQLIALEKNILTLYTSVQDASTMVC